MKTMLWTILLDYREQGWKCARRCSEVKHFRSFCCQLFCSGAPYWSSSLDSSIGIPMVHSSQAAVHLECSSHWHWGWQQRKESHANKFWQVVSLAESKIEQGRLTCFWTIFSGEFSATNAKRVALLFAAKRVILLMFLSVKFWSKIQSLSVSGWYL